MSDYFSISSLAKERGTLTLECQSGSNGLDKVIFKLWKGKSHYEIWHSPRLKDHDLVKLAVKVLGSEHAMKHCAHVYVPGLRLVKGMMSWSQKVVEMRRTVLSYSGRFGEPLPDEGRRLFFDRKGFNQGDFSVTWDAASSEWVFTGTASFQLLCDVLALVLRDQLTAQTDRRYYVPWLFTRPISDWEGSKLRQNAVGLKPIAGWKPVEAASEPAPPNIKPAKKLVMEPTAIDISIDESLEAIELPKDAIQLNVVAVVSLNDVDFADVALHKREDGTFQIVKVLADHMTDEGVRYWGDPSRIVYFPTFKDLLEFWVGVGCSVEFQNENLPPFEHPRKQCFSTWLPRFRSRPSISQRQCRDSIAAHLRKMKATLPELDLQMGLKPRVGRIALLENPFLTGGLYYRTAGGLENPVITREEVLKLILLTLSDGEAKVSEQHYFPELAVALKLWRRLKEEEGLDEPFATEQSGTEATPEQAAPVAEAIAESGAVEATESAVKFVSPSELTQPFPPNLATSEIPAEVARRLDQGFAAILVRHGVKE